VDRHEWYLNFRRGDPPSENYVTGKKVPFHYPAGRRLTATASDSPRCATAAATAEEACHEAFKNSTNSACHAAIRRTRVATTGGARSNEIGVDCGCVCKLRPKPSLEVHRPLRHKELGKHRKERAAVTYFLFHFQSRVCFLSEHAG